MFIVKRFKKNGEYFFSIEAEGHEAEETDELINIWICDSLAEATLIVELMKNQ